MKKIKKLMINIKKVLTKIKCSVILVCVKYIICINAFFKGKKLKMKKIKKLMTNIKKVLTKIKYSVILVYVKYIICIKIKKRRE